MEKQTAGKPKRKLSGAAAMGAGPGRPKGVPNKANADIKAAAAIHGPAALQVLLDIAQDEEKPPAARVAAAQAVLDRGYGKPTQAIGGPDGGPIEHVVRMRFVPKQ